MQKLQPTPAGAHVEVRGEPWIVVRAEAFDSCTLVTLRGTGDENLGHTTELLAPFDRLKAVSRSSRVRRVSRPHALRAAARSVTRAHEWSEPWTTTTARMELLPWQLEPAMAAVRGATRLLLADGVGLGKTIQAGLILAELRARGFISRALVLTPASLREQWAAELGDRFALEPVVLDHAALARLAADLPPGVNPWTVAEIAISSIDLVKRGEVRRALDAVPLDALVVDEAHHLRPGTDRGALVKDLASRVPWLVLATATPHWGDEQAYAFLQALGASGGAGEIQTFRRGARAVHAHRARRVVFHGVHATPVEQAVLDESLAYARAIWRRHKGLVASVICRRAVSSAAALVRTLTRRLELLESTAPSPHLQSELPWQEHDERDAVESDSTLGAARLDDTAHEIEWLGRLIRLAERAAGRSSKIAAIERVLARTGEAAIVFSEYRDTLACLQERLAGHVSLAVIHGGLTARERTAAIQNFVGGGARVLLATDAAGEGLNLQQRCRLVVNVELPWSPLRLEQRIGRVDRLGQRRRVHAINLVHRGSFEDEVLARFEERLLRAARDLSDLRVDEDEIAAAVFDGDVQRAGMMAIGPAQTSPPVDSRVCEVADLRRRAAQFARGCAVGPLCTTPRRTSSARHIVALFECDFHDDSGRLVARGALPLVVDLDRPILLRRANVRDVAHALAASADVQHHVTTAIANLEARTAADVRRTAFGVETRLNEILRGLASSKPKLWQGSLFDRKVEQQARASEAAAMDIREHLQRRLAGAHALRQVDSSAPRLIALWPLDNE
jgi:superfamily II DNA or RNA helicase